MPELKNVSNELVAAIEANDGITFSTLLRRRDIDVNAQNRDGITPLIATVKNKNTLMFMKLFNHPDIDQQSTDRDGKTALHYAVEGKRAIMTAYLRGV